jgi:cytochrome c oxidase subunit 3
LSARESSSGDFSGRPAGDDLPADLNPNPALSQVARDPFGGPYGAAALEAHGHSMVAHQFDDLAQQHEASTLGMWAFLATEIMFFGGALVGYAVYRHSYYDAFSAASRLENWRIGGLNTGILLFSSLFVVLAVHSAQTGSRRGIVRWLLATVVFGAAFIAVKGYEYHHLFREQLVPGASFDAPRFENGEPLPHHFPEHLREPAQIFYAFYFCLTGIHALHMIVGIGLVLYVAWLAHRGRFTPEYHNPVEMTGLYWHFVDIVWIFLYPLLYLISPT